MHSETLLQVREPTEGEKPKAIVYPSSTEDVSRILRICHNYRMPVTAFSEGTLLDIHQDDFDIVGQPAVGWQDLNEQLAPYGVFFGPDPGPGAQIGGTIGTSCSGTNAYRYGTMRQNVGNAR